HGGYRRRRGHGRRWWRRRQLMALAKQRTTSFQVHPAKAEGRPLMAERSRTTHPLERSFRRHQRLLWGLCYRMTGSPSDADDLVQETFARAIERPPADGAREIRPWLVRVAMNLSRDHLRRRRRRG